MEPVYSDEEFGELRSSVPSELSKPKSEIQERKLKELLVAYKGKLNEIHNIKTEEPCIPRAMSLEYQPYEKSIGILEMTNASHSDLTKVLTVFTYLITEVRLAKDYLDTYALSALNYYGEGLPSDLVLSEGQPEIMIGHMSSFLGETFENLAYVNSLVLNLVHQLNSVYNKKQPKNHEIYSKLFKEVRLFPVLDSLGKMLSTLAKIDAVINDNESLVHHWDLYKRLMQFVKTEPSKYNIQMKFEKQLRKCLLYLDKSIMSANCLNACLKQGAFDPKIGNNKELLAEFQQYFKSRLERVYGNMETQYEWDDREEVLDITCLYLLFRRLFTKEFDKKLFKGVWSLQKKAPAVVVTGHVIVIPAELIMNHAPPLKRCTLDPKDSNSSIGMYLNKLDNGLEEYIKNWNSKYSVWAARMQSFLTCSAQASESQIFKLQENRGKLLLQGLLLANQIKTYVQLTTALHDKSGTPFRVNFVPYVMEAIEIVKAIVLTLERHQEIIVLSLNPIIKIIVANALAPFNEFRERITRSGGKAKDELLNVFRIMDSLSKGPISPTRLDMMKLCGSILDSKGMIQGNERNNIMDGLWKLEILTEFQDSLKKVSDCSFVYWIQEINSHFMKYVKEKPSNVNRLKYLFMALEDGAKQLLLSKHAEDPKTLKELYLQEREKELHNEIIMPIARAIESDLRLYAHALAISGIAKQNPLEVENLSKFLESQPITFCEKIIDIKKKIEVYLDETFYNMTTLNLNDWKIYEEMRALAKPKYKLDLSSVHLPAKHLEQGMDLLEITKRLPSFVTKFKYNLHSQFFMEATHGDDKHVQCFTYMHLTYSLKTHGLGLVNSTINTTYKLLTKRFQVFSQFLYDTHIWSQLNKDRKYFEGNKEGLNQMFPYQRADNFNKEIRRLGTFEGGITYLDKFRQLVTQIGNTIGLIRMIKTASLNLTSTKTQFIPDTQNVPNFLELANLYSDETKVSAQTLDKILESITKNFTEDTNYFMLLVKTFQGVLNNSETKHLNLFYMIIPTLTISYVDSLLRAKDKLSKKKADDMYFTDDGFAVGLAYILRVLEQESNFDSLNWFESIEATLNEEEERLANTAQSDEVQKVQQISMRKVQVYRLEFDLLKYSLSGARIFFSET